MSAPEFAKILSSQSNVAVVQMPSRHYPGSVIQGDSLFSLLSDTLDMLEELRGHPDSEAFHAAYSIAERLDDRLQHYIATCKANGIEWTFKTERSFEDYASLIGLGD